MILVFAAPCLRAFRVKWSKKEVEIEKICSSETYISTYKSARRYNPEEQRRSERSSFVEYAFFLINSKFV